MGQKMFYQSILRIFLLFLFSIFYGQIDVNSEQIGQNVEQNEENGLKFVISTEQGKIRPKIVLNRQIVGKKAAEIVETQQTDLTLPFGANPLLKAILAGLKGYLLGGEMRHRGIGERLEIGKQPKLIGENWPPPNWMELSEWAAIWQEKVARKNNLLFTAFAPSAFEEIRRKLGIQDRQLLNELAKAFGKFDGLKDPGNEPIRLEIKAGNDKFFVIRQIEMNGMGKELREFHRKVVEEGIGPDELPNKLLLGIFRVQQIKPEIDLIFALLEEKDETK